MSIHWTEIVAAVYAICDAVKLDPVLNKIESIHIGDQMVIVRYTDEEGVLRHVSEKYEF